MDNNIPNEAQPHETQGAQNAPMNQPVNPMMNQPVNQPVNPMMNQPVNPQYVYTQTAQPQFNPVPVIKPLSGLGVAGMVLGIIGVVLCLIPILNNASILLGILAIIFALCSFKATSARGKKRGRGIVIASLVLGIISLVVSLAVQMMWSQALDKASKTFESSSKKIENLSKGIVNEGAKSLTLMVKATSPTDVNFSIDSATSNFSTNNGVWEKTITGKDASKMYMISTLPKFDINNPVGDNYQVECLVKLDGKQISHKTATGSSATVFCSSQDQSN